MQASQYAKTHTCCELKKSTFKVLPFTVSLGFFVNGVLFMRLQKKLFSVFIVGSVKVFRMFSIEIILLI